MLNSEIYMPADYVICRGEIGEEMFFIAEGSLLILTKSLRVKMKKLKGEYVGELALFS